MSDQIFKDRVIAHSNHVINVGSHCNTEETTKQALKPLAITITQNLKRDEHQQPTPPRCMRLQTNIKAKHFKRY